VAFEESKPNVDELPTSAPTASVVVLMRAFAKLLLSTTTEQFVVPDEAVPFKLQLLVESARATRAVPSDKARPTKSPILSRL